MPPKAKVTAKSKTAEVSSRKRNFDSGLFSLEMDKEFPLSSSTEKRKRDEDAIDPACLATPEHQINSGISLNTSSASGSEVQSSLSTQGSSSTSSNQLLSSLVVSSHKKGSNKAHIEFSYKKQVYLQDSLDPIDEKCLQINDAKV